MSSKHETLYKKIDDIREELVEIAMEIFNNPEIGYQEYNSSRLLTEYLAKNDFLIERGLSGLETSFRATYDSRIAGKTIGLIAEYDALPEIGHACGHNLFSVAACGTAIALKDSIDEIGGKVVVVGTPSEEGTVENAGGKVIMARDGIFDDLDIAMMCHGDESTYIERYLVAATSMTVRFFGTEIHAGGDVTFGRNALTAANLTISNINAIRQHFFPRAVVNPIITKGGIVPNTLARETELKFTIRSTKRKDLGELIRRIENCVKAAGLTTDCEYEIIKQENVYEDTRPNTVLAKSFGKALDRLGIEYYQKNEANFAWDIGNVSYRVPTLCPYIKIGPDGILCHSVEFLEASSSQGGFDGLVVGAKAMASTALDYLESEDIQKAVFEEFQAMDK